jgi:hypothetical protein
MMSTSEGAQNWESVRTALNLTFFISSKINPQVVFRKHSSRLNLSSWDNMAFLQPVFLAKTERPVILNVEGINLRHAF